MLFSLRFIVFPFMRPFFAAIDARLKKGRQHIFRFKKSSQFFPYQTIFNSATQDIILYSAVSIKFDQFYCFLNLRKISFSRRCNWWLFSQSYNSIGIWYSDGAVTIFGQFISFMYVFNIVCFIWKKLTFRYKKNIKLVQYQMELGLQVIFCPLSFYYSIYFFSTEMKVIKR